MQNNPGAVFDRVAFNECCVKAIAKCEMDLASELNKLRAAYKAWEQAGSIPSLKPKGKKGNIITRMYARTGWWPLCKDSELW